MQKVNCPASLLFQSVFLLFFILNHSSKRSVQAQSLPPAKYDGFVYKSYPVDADTIIVEAFFDPVCPDSRDSWPTLKEALEHYGPRVSLVVHLLPLPLVSPFFLFFFSYTIFQFHYALRDLHDFNNGMVMNCSNEILCGWRKSERCRSSVRFLF